MVVYTYLCSQIFISSTDKQMSNYVFSTNQCCNMEWGPAKLYMNSIYKQRITCSHHTWKKVNSIDKNTSSQWFTSKPCLMNNRTKFKEPVWALKCNKLAPSCCQIKDLFFSIPIFEFTKYIPLFSDILSSNYQHTSICALYILSLHA